MLHISGVCVLPHQRLAHAWSAPALPYLDRLHVLIRQVGTRAHKHGVAPDGLVVVAARHREVLRARLSEDCRTAWSRSEVVQCAKSCSNSTAIGMRVVIMQAKVEHQDVGIDAGNSRQVNLRRQRLVFAEITHLTGHARGPWWLRCHGGMSARMACRARPVELIEVPIRREPRKIERREPPANHADEQIVERLRTQTRGTLPRTHQHSTSRISPRCILRDGARAANIR